MPYSKSQKIAACIALAVKRGKAKRSSLKGASLQMFKGMTEAELEDICKGPIKKTPMAAR